MTRFFDETMYVEIEMDNWTGTGYGEDWTDYLLQAIGYPLGKYNYQTDTYSIEDSGDLCFVIMEYAARIGDYADVPYDETESVSVRVGYSLDRLHSIRNAEHIAFDNQGRHATGREVLSYSADGSITWLTEYVGDDTEDLPLTEWVDWDRERE